MHLTLPIFAGKANLNYRKWRLLSIIWCIDENINLTHSCDGIVFCTIALLFILCFSTYTLFVFVFVDGSGEEGRGYELGYEMKGWVMRGVDMSWVMR